MSLGKSTVYDLKLYVPISSSNKTHRVIQLSNGLVALLISDPSETLASCAVSVATGSHKDPVGIPGLAHLCEHMIMSSGSKKYPESNYLNQILTKNNGSQNAHTTGEQTSFHFEVPNTTSAESLVFDEIVDILAASLKEPVFTETLINKEIYAIESEHVGNKTTLDKVLYHGTRLLANSEHPFHRFCTGNMITLTSMPKLHNMNLKAELIRYFKENFVSENMVLCLKGSQSINQLAKLAQSTFGTVPAGTANLGQGLKLKPWRRNSQPSPPNSPTISKSVNDMHKLKDTWLPYYLKKSVFSDLERDRVLLIKSSKTPVLRMIFPINYLSTRFSDREIATYKYAWCELLGDESQGSLCHCLREANFLTDLTAYPSTFATNDDGLVLQLHLTNSGWKHVSEIIPMIWEYSIKAIMNSPLSELGQYLSEMNSMDLLRFLYQELASSPMEVCSELCDKLMQDMMVSDPSFILKSTGVNFDCNDPTVSSIGSYSESKQSKEWWKGQAVKFQSFLNEFTSIENVRLILLGDIQKCDLYDENEQLKTDTYYDYDYIKTNVIILNLNVYRTDYKFTIPARNPFLVPVGHKLSFIKEALAVSSLQSEVASLAILTSSELLKTSPKLIGKSQFYELWTKEEDLNLSFKSKSIVSVEYINTNIKPAPLHTMQLEIFGQLLHEILAPTLYPAERAGYTYELALSSKGDVRFGLTISGFTDGVVGILELIVTTMVQIAKGKRLVSRETFRKARVKVRNKYEAAASENCATLASLGLLIVLEECMWSLEDRLEALEVADMDSFYEFMEKFVEGESYLNLMIQGSDISIADKINIYLDQHLTHHLAKEGRGTNILVEPSTYKIPDGSNLCVKRKGFDDDPNNSIVYFIQTGSRDDIYAFSLTAFTEFVMHLTLVPDLRSKKQIGYLVLGGVRVLSDTVGLHITTMASTPPEFLEIKIEEYLAYLESYLSKLSTEQFKTQFVQEYVQLIKSKSTHKIEKTSGPSNLMAHIEANVRSGLVNTSVAMKSHKRLRNQITYRSYNFEDDDEPVNERVISSLTLLKYLQFFQEKISIRSKTRAKLSVMISSPMTKEAIENKMMFLQLESFLKIKGFSISSEKLKDILDKTEGKSTALFKELFVYFRSRGESLKLCSVVLKEVVKQLVRNSPSGEDKVAVSAGTSGSLHRMSQNVVSVIPLVEITDVNTNRI
ncbi:HDL064Cp [Eremothecium sinecaudum]|uniref:HDL064Cp n=1 Tax=Eremothecium sinecaudum TaxID=45286 RepID=A0A0X8HSI8_9SACH|nr:HDL064Cp [Eremothecium sinecaudum]AMD20680.1 HDL064Cp [Eremothecium sinecaudum]